MKKALTSILLFVLLCSCGEMRQSEAERLCEFWSEVGEVSASMSMRAEFDYYSVDFRMDCSYSEGKCIVTILEPVEIKNVTVNVEADSVFLDYDGMTLEAGDRGNLAPATVFAELVRIWQTGYISENGSERRDGKDYIYASYSCGEYVFSVLFDAETFAPYEAEIFTDGQRIMLCKFENVTFGKMTINS